MKTLCTNGQNSSPQIRRSTSFINFMDGSRADGRLAGGFASAGAGGLRDRRLRRAIRRLHSIVGELVAEVVFAGVGVVGQRARVPGGAYLAVGDDVGALGDAEGRLDVVVGDEDADVAILELHDDLLDVLDGDRIDAGEGL